MHVNSIRETTQKIWVGTLSVYLILAVSLGATLAYWYILAGASNADSAGTFWKYIIWLVVAVGLVAELIKKLTLSTFRNMTIWAVSTFVSVLTVMGTYSILDNQKQNELVKQSDGYQMAKGQKAEALKKQAQYAYAQNFDIETLKTKKRKAGNKAHWGTFNSLKKDIEAKKNYDSAVNVLALSNQNMAVGNAGRISSNPLLSNIADLLGLSENFIKSSFYFIVTLLLEISAFWIGGQVERLRLERDLTRAEILDRQNQAMFGVSIQDFNRALFENVVSAQVDRLDADQEIKQLRKERKNRPTLDTVKQIKELKNEVDYQQEQAKNPPSLDAEDAPFQVHENIDSVPKKVHPESVPNGVTTGGGTGTRRKKETPDTGTTGANSHRYNALKSAVQKGEVQPTHRGIKSFKYGGRGMGDDTAKIYKQALRRDSVL